MINLITKLFIKFFLKKHPFTVTTLISKRNSDLVFEVQKAYYDSNLEPVVVATVVDNGDRVVTISGVDLQEYSEYTGNLNGTIIQI